MTELKGYPLLMEFVSAFCDEADNKKYIEDTVWSILPQTHKLENIRIGYFIASDYLSKDTQDREMRWSIQFDCNQDDGLKRGVEYRQNIRLTLYRIGKLVTAESKSNVKIEMNNVFGADMDECINRYLGINNKPKEDVK